VLLLADICEWIWRLNWVTREVFVGGAWVLGISGFGFGTGILIFVGQYVVTGWCVGQACPERNFNV